MSESEGIVSFEDWQKLDLRVAEIKEVEEIKGADKLYKLTLDVGEVGEKVVCAGIKEYYSKDELKGKKIILFTNLAPRKLKGIVSEGMILAAVNEEEGRISLIIPEEDIKVGSKVR
ncbi:methionine--tRNA ligase subunit beta [Candidatus Pacearchaeota archaeon]|nr:MAG: methionine--tRNA ligase subunit beta [Candidatus Pacearchaeota archaeon]